MAWQSIPVRGFATVRIVDDKIRFVWVTDTHINDAISDNQTNLLLSIEHCKNIRPQFMLHTGDIADVLLGQLRKSMYFLRECQTELFTVIGNHDEEEYTLGTGHPNTAQLIQADIFKQQPPFLRWKKIYSGDLSWSLLCIQLDQNYYDDTTSEYHSVGDRIGNSYDDPVGGYKRQFGSYQLSLVNSIVSSISSDAIAIFTHYPPGVGSYCLDYASLVDIFQTDSRPVFGFCGHDHADAESITATSTDEGYTITFYKLPALYPSGCYAECVLSLTESVLSLDSAVIYNYTAQDGWTINLPFTVDGA